MKSPLKLFFQILVGIFACIGLVFSVVYAGMQAGFFNVRGSITARNDFFQSTPITPKTLPCDDQKSVCDWNQTPEWQVVKGGLQKDASVIKKVGNETGVSPRMIAAVVVPEQTRFFTSNREVFKRYFEPLKILGSLSQFSLGVSGIKQATADNIEKYAADQSSPRYAGEGMAALIAYSNPADHDTVLYTRLTEPKDHYYQYLYTALFIKEIENEWKNAGYDIHDKPEVIVTLFNLGFQASHPNPNPGTGGAPIGTGGQTYSYGQLGSAFYHSQELSDVFPQ